MEHINYRQIDKELIRLTQDLINIPSWLPQQQSKRKHQNENKVVSYLEKWFLKNTDFEVFRQKLGNNRHNLIVRKGNPDILFLGHTDTVRPSPNAPFDPLTAKIDNGKIWGLGSTDMKSGIAAICQAIRLSKNTNNVWAVFYADEEYDFIGMKALIKDYSHIKPKIIISADGSDLKFGHGCRGLIEFRLQVRGQTGHPARGTGNNSIWQTFQSLSQLNEFLQQSSHPIMGAPSFNLAYILGGSLEKDSIVKKRLQKVGQAGNVVPDITEIVVDIRPSLPDMNINTILNKLKTFLKTRKLNVKIIEKTHNFGAWYTNPSQLKKYTKIAQNSLNLRKIVFDNPQASGYIDLQMFWDKVGRPPAFMFGGGAGDTAHTPQEYISITNLIKTRDFFLNILS